MSRQYKFFKSKPNQTNQLAPQPHISRTNLYHPYGVAAAPSARQTSKSTSCRNSEHKFRLQVGVSTANHDSFKQKSHHAASNQSLPPPLEYLQQNAILKIPITKHEQEIRDAIEYRFARSKMKGYVYDNTIQSPVIDSKYKLYEELHVVVLKDYHRKEKPPQSHRQRTQQSEISKSSNRRNHTQQQQLYLPYSMSSAGKQTSRNSSRSIGHETGSNKLKVKGLNPIKIEGYLKYCPDINSDRRQIKLQFSSRRDPSRITTTPGNHQTSIAGQMCSTSIPTANNPSRSKHRGSKSTKKITSSITTQRHNISELSLRLKTQATTTFKPYRPKGIKKTDVGRTKVKEEGIKSFRREDSVMSAIDETKTMRTRSYG